MLRITNQGAHMNTLESFHIYIATKKKNQINDTSTITSNVIFDTSSKYTMTSNVTSEVDMVVPELNPFTDSHCPNSRRGKRTEITQEG